MSPIAVHVIDGNEHLGLFDHALQRFNTASSSRPLHRCALFCNEERYD